MHCFPVFHARFPALFALGMEVMCGAMVTSAAERQCGTNLEPLRFVLTPQGSRLPLYWDPGLISYLTQTYRATQPPGPATAGLLALPLYSPDAMMFRLGPYVFVTTGLLARIEDETELVERFGRIVPLAHRRVSRPDTQWLPYCGQIAAAEPALFEPVWRALKDSLLRYQERTHMRLKRRPTKPVIGLL